MGYGLRTEEGRYGQIKAALKTAKTNWFLQFWSSQASILFTLLSLFWKPLTHILAQHLNLFSAEDLRLEDHDQTKNR